MSDGSLPSSHPLRGVLLELAAAPELSLPSVPRLPAPGQRIGRFEMLRELGRGGFGVVVEARDVALGRHVALKLVRPARSIGGGGDEALSQLQREAETAARLGHPNIVTLFDFGVDQGVPFLVMELLSGETLQERLARGPLSAEAALDLAVQAARAVVHAHASSVIHRDLKPGNLFLCSDGRAKVLDFGLARALSALTGEESGAGTPAFMAPEQRRREPEDERTDVYGLGAILAAAVTGKPPAQGLEGVPVALQPILSRALAADPRGRQPTAQALLDELLSARQQQGAPAAEERAPYRWLSPFTEGDAGSFFGREADVGRVLQRLDAQALVAIVGPSGAGKSSLVQAGVVPALRRRGERWLCLAVRPGTSALEALSNRVAEACGEDAGSLPTGAALREGLGLIGRALRAHAQRTGQRILIFVDQLEELYTQGETLEARRDFARALLAVADDPHGPLRVVLTVRDDFLARLAEEKGFSEAAAAGIHLLGAPDEEGLIEAAAAPARARGYSLEEGLCEEMVAVLRHEIAPLPLLQLAASRLWDERDPVRRLVTRESLTRLGGMRGVLGAHASEVLRSLGTQAELDEARRMALRLVTAQRTRRQELSADLVSTAADRDVAARTLRHLIAGRLLTALRTERGEAVELAHELLIEGWDELRGWLHQTSDLLRRKEPVARAAQLWEGSGRPRDLLFRGERLQAALRLREEAGPLLGASELGFIAEGKALLDRGRARRNWLFAGAASLFAIAAAALVLLTLSARRSAREARARAIVAAAPALADPVAGALLLAELEGEPEPPGGLTAAYAVATDPLPAAVLRGHSAAVTALAYSRDGRLLATGSHDHTVRVVASDGSGPARVLRGHEGIITSVTFTRDGARLISTAQDGTARLFTLATGESRIVARDDFEIWGAQLTADERAVLAPGTDREARLWDLGGGGLIARFPHARGVTAAILSADGRRVVTSSWVETAKLWDLSGRLIKSVPVETSTLDAGPSIAFDPSGKLFAVAAPGGAIELYESEAGGNVRTLRGHSGFVSSLRFSADGRSLLSAGADGTARIWPTGREGAPQIFRQAGPVHGAALSPDGARVLTWAPDGTARLWASDGSAGPAVQLRGPRGLLLAGFAPDGQSIALGSVDGSVRIFKLDAAPTPVRVVAAGAVEAALAISADGEAVVVGGQQTSQIVSSRGSGPVAVLPFPLVSAAFAPDGTDRLLLVTPDGHALYADRGSSAQPRPLPVHDAGRASFSPDGRAIVLCREGAFSFSLAPGGEREAPRKISEVTNKPWAYTADARRWVVTRLNVGHLVQIGPVSSDRILGNGHESRMRAAAFSRDETRVVTGGSDHTARVYRDDDLEHPLVLRGHEGAVVGTDFTADGRVVTIGQDGTLRVWTREGREEVVIRSHQGWLFKLAVARAAPVVATSDDVGTVRVFRLLTWQQMIAWLRASTSACLLPADRERYLGESPSAARNAFERCERAHGR